jgi:exo-beta-1,3-glucanase (GH17 family)
MRNLIFYTVAAIVNAASASYQGFNYAAQGNDRESFHQQFSLSTSLPGMASFSSARLYTMVQEGGNETVIQAIPAALATNTKLLLGLWTSVDEDGFAKQLSALESAMTLYGSQGLSDLVIGISVGSEDLYRSSVLGTSSDSGVGQDISVLLEYIQKVRALLQGSVLQHIPVGVSMSTHRAWGLVMLTISLARGYFGRLHKSYEQRDSRGSRLHRTQHFSLFLARPSSKYFCSSTFFLAGLREHATSVSR